MAAQYDPFGTYLGDYETEEERKKREELANTTVHTQEIKTYGDGTQERITKEEIPGAIAPKTVSTPAGPVAPTDPVFQRQLQAESGNQQNDPRTGQIMTSPKGALGIAQIMPSTAMSPGYGVPDIFTLAQQRGIQVPNRSQATAQQLLANKELNQEFGQLYSNAMRQRFGDQAGVAAYNAGPGAVERNMARNQGQFNVAQAPQETQGYLNKVMRGVGNVVNAVIPSAQAGTLPQPQAGAGRGVAGMPQAVPGEGVAVATGRGVQGTTSLPGAPSAPVDPSTLGQIPQVAQPQIQIDDEGNRLITNPDGSTTILGPDNRPLAAGGMEPRDTPQFRNRLFEEAGKDPMRWMEISKNPEYAQFPGMQEVAKQQARTLLEHDFKMEAATKQVEATVAAATAGDPKAGRAIADELKKQEGSWAKMILLGFLSPQLAGEEAVKLGFGNRWTSVTDQEGKTALIQVNAKGMPLSGITPDNKPLSETELARFASGGGAARKLNIVGGSYVNDKTGEVGRMVTDEKTGTTYIQTDTGRKPMAGFRPQSSTGTLDMQRVQQIQRQNIDLAGDWAKLQMKIQGAGPEAANKYLGEFNTKHKVNIPMQAISGSAPQISLETGQMTLGGGAAPAAVASQPAPAQAPAVSQAAPAQAPTQAPAQAPTQTPAQAAPATTPLDKLPKAPTMNPGESPEAFAQRTKAWADTYGKQYEQVEKNVKAAKDLLPFINQMKSLIDKSTSSGIGSIVDRAGSWVGYSTDGANAIAAIAPLASKVLMGVERFEGPQSEMDVKAYKEAAGKLADPTVPAQQKQSAFATIIEIMKRNAPGLDWDSVSGGAATGSGTTSSGNKFKKVQ